MTPRRALLLALTCLLFTLLAWGWPTPHPEPSCCPVTVATAPGVSAVPAHIEVARSAPNEPNSTTLPAHIEENP